MAEAGHNTKVYTEQGGDIQRIASGGSLIADSGSTATLAGTKSDGTTNLSATFAMINTACDRSTKVVALTPTAGQTITLDAATYADKTILITTTTVSFNLALPAFDGTTGKRRIVFGGNLSSATVTISATGAHLFGGVIQNTDSSVGFATGFTVAKVNAGGSTNIAVNGTTQGGRKGDWIEIEDVATAHGEINGLLNASGSEATPFS